ncbi:MAG: FeoB-associated Cys-rich membrane protein [Flavobacteriaceae bacterium]|jgi:hypothetical protein
MMEVLQNIIAVLLGLGSLIYLINRFKSKKKPATDANCGGGCGCKK